MKGYLRKADENDMNLLFNWANESMVRKNSFSSKEILYEEHKAWYKNLLNRTDCVQYIYMDKTEAVGQVRLTIKGSVAEIAYSICAPKRCMGYGKTMLRLIYEQVKIDFPQIKKLIAKVKPDNIASKKAFLDVGYTECYDTFEIEIEKKNNIQDIEESSNFGGGNFTIDE